MLSRLSIAIIITIAVGLNPTDGWSQESQSVPSEFVRNYIGAVHLGEEHHTYANKIGITWGRQGATWDNIEPEKGRFKFDDYDRLTKSAKKHNIQVLTVLNHSAPWASSAPEGVEHRDKYPFKEESIPDWKEYVETVVKRYPEVEYFEVWNEPNIDWFLRSEENYKIYIERILKPAAEVIRKHGRKVVGLSFTTEWPLDSWPTRERPRKHAENVESNIKAMEQWLSYEEAWKYIDIISIHYTHGDFEQKGPNADNMMAFYDYLFENWIDTGKIDGVWNTEEGFAGVEAGTQGFVGLDRWEHPPLSQWAARYTIPVLHWAIQHDWQQRDQYKIFWYHMSEGDHPRDMLRPTEGDSLELTETSQALKTIIRELSSADSLGTYDHPLKVGFGLHSQDTTAINYFAPYEFKNYAFAQDDDLFLASWLDLPKISGFGQPVQVKVEGIEKGREISIERVDHLTGEYSSISSYEWLDEQTLFIEIPPTDEPVLYLRINHRD